MTNTLTAATNLPQSFRLWLQSKNYSSSTIRNYLVDTNKYLASQDGSATQIFSSKSLSNYIQAINGQNNSSRQLASLNKFCQFALDQKLVDYNPLPQILKQLDQDAPSVTLAQLLSEFSKYLLAHHKTPATIKNYLNDINQFINWSQSEPQ